MANKDNRAILLILFEPYSGNVIQKIIGMTEDAVLTCNIDELCNFRIVAPLKPSVQGLSIRKQRDTLYTHHSNMLHPRFFG